MYYKPDIKIAVAEDHELYREGLISRLKKEENLCILGDFENGKELLTFFKSNPVDIILMDVSMLVLDGVQTSKQITSDYPDVKVIALTMYDTDSVILDMLLVGASGYLLKNTSFYEMLDSIYKVYDGNTAYSRSIYHRIVELMGENRLSHREAEKNNEFNETEIQIIRLLSQCYSAREIGEILGISDRTIEGYKARLLLKLDVKNATGIVVMALKRRLNTLNDC